MAEKERIGAAIAESLHVVGDVSYEGVTPGTTAAGKPLVVDGNKALDTLTIAGGGLVLGANTTAKKVAKVALTGNAIHAGVVAWANPEAGAIVINHLTLDVTTIATAAATIEIGTTATNATTASANLIDTLDVHTATGTFDNNANPGTNGKKLQKLAAGKWVTFGEASGDLTGMVGTAYIEYLLV